MQKFTILEQMLLLEGPPGVWTSSRRLAGRNTPSARERLGVLAADDSRDDNKAKGIEPSKTGPKTMEDAGLSPTPVGEKPVPMTGEVPPPTASPVSSPTNPSPPRSLETIKAEGEALNDRLSSLKGGYGVPKPAKEKAVEPFPTKETPVESSPTKETTGTASPRKLETIKAEGEALNTKADRLGRVGKEFYGPWGEPFGPNPEAAGPMPASQGPQPEPVGPNPEAAGPQPEPAGPQPPFAGPPAGSPAERLRANWKSTQAKERKEKGLLDLIAPPNTQTGMDSQKLDQFARGKVMKSVVQRVRKEVGPFSYKSYRGGKFKERVTARLDDFFNRQIPKDEKEKSDVFFKKPEWFNDPSYQENPEAFFANREAQNKKADSYNEPAVLRKQQASKEPPPTEKEAPPSSDLPNPEDKADLDAAGIPTVGGAVPAGMAKVFAAGLGGAPAAEKPKGKAPSEPSPATPSTKEGELIHIQNTGAKKKENLGWLATKGALAGAAHSIIPALKFGIKQAFRLGGMARRIAKTGGKGY